MTIENQLLRIRKFRLAGPLKKKYWLDSLSEVHWSRCSILKERRRKREGAPFLRKIANQLQTEIGIGKIEENMHYLLKDSLIGSEA